MCEEEDYKWWARTPITAEANLPFAVAVDVCASYLSVTESLRLPAGCAGRTSTDPAWDGGKIGRPVVVRLHHHAVDDLLPHPATFHGLPPRDRAGTPPRPWPT